MLGQWVQNNGYSRGVVRVVYIDGSGNVILLVSYRENEYGSGETGRLDTVPAAEAKLVKGFKGF